LAIDFTARDLQEQCKRNGWPWEIAKAWDGSAVVGNPLPVSLFGDMQNLHFELKVNGETRQTGHTAQMIHPINELVAYISSRFSLSTGDVILTGTPAGVGPVKIGDVLEGFLEGTPALRCEIR